jgi:hypothetical protein
MSECMVTQWSKTLLVVNKAQTCVEALGPRMIDNFWLPIYRCSHPSAEVLCESCAGERRCFYAVSCVAQALRSVAERERGRSSDIGASALGKGMTLCKLTLIVSVSMMVGLKSWKDARWRAIWWCRGRIGSPGRVAYRVDRGMLLASCVRPNTHHKYCTLYRRRCKPTFQRW